ncbi:MAG: glutaminyl-peptide cyclotransferase, partial [Gemmatimonadaceae bacterium]
MISVQRVGRHSLCLLSLMISLSACDRERERSDAGTVALPSSMRTRPGTNAEAVPPPVPYDPATPRLVFPAVKSWPHDTAAYTQGLIVHDGRLLESTGLEGHSEIREVDRTTGHVKRRATLQPNLFGEGIAVVAGRIFQLTWQSGHGFVYDASTLAPQDSFTYTGEGWGLTTDGERLYMSDGSSHVRVVKPEGFQTERTFQVTESGRPVWMLNELEWIRGELWANIYETDL